MKNKSELNQVSSILPTDFSLPKLLNDYLQKKNIEISKEDGLNAIIYGIPCKRVIKKKAHSIDFFQINQNKTILSIANKSKDTIETINLRDIKMATFSGETENLFHCGLILSDRVINFLVGQETLDFVFPTPNDFHLFIKGIIELFELSSKPQEGGFNDRYLKGIWMKYDHDFSGKMEKKEFKRFVTELGRNLDYKALMLMLDTNMDGVIDFSEFITYFKQFINGEEFRKIFERFETGYNYIDRKGLMKFYSSVQKENISELDACMILIKFTQKLTADQKEVFQKEIMDLYSPENAQDKDEIVFTKEQEDVLQMTLQEFKMLLNSNFNSVYNSSKGSANCPTNRPMNDYFINSSHNTYLTGHQLTGESSVDMYSTAMVEGYRLVELDCYDGKKDDIIITHGYTMAGEIKLRDILRQLRATAFVSSQFPVILSIENHLDKEHQAIMTNDFKNILKDLYIFPFDNPPDYLPDLKVMMGKFLIKCGGKRVQKDRSLIKPRSSTDYSVKGHVTTGFKKLFMNAIIKKEEEKMEEEKGKEELKIEIEENQPPKLKAAPPKEELKMFADITSDPNELKKLKELKKNTEVTAQLDHVRGLLGTKFKLDKIRENNYQPWEFVTIKSTKFPSFCESFEKRKAIILFNQNSMMKAYPQAFDSSNYDPIKCWIVGCHVASMNIQALEDDWRLINLVFFKKQNKNCGYVLKPKKLLPGTTFFETYEKPYGKLRIKLLTASFIMRLVEKANIEIAKNLGFKLTTQIFGSLEDDKSNRKYSSKVVGNYFFPNFENNEIVFDVYEKDLSCVLIKLYYDDTVVGRCVVPLCVMNEGIRKVPFYSNDSVESRFSCLIAEFNKNF